MNCKICSEFFNNNMFNNELCKYCYNKYYWCEICDNYSKSTLCTKHNLITNNIKPFIFFIICCFLIYKYIFY